MKNTELLTKSHFLLFQERENTLLEFDEDSQSLMDIIRDTTSHSLMNSKVTHIT